MPCLSGLYKKYDAKPLKKCDLGFKKLETQYYRF